MPTNANECKCPDCMETTRSGPYCKSCKESGCQPGEECQSPAAWSPGPFASAKKATMITLKKNASGYVDCGCRDCMEIAIGEPGALCSECEEAGCDPDEECQAPGAYGGDGDEEHDASKKTAEGGYHDVDLRTLGEKMMHWHDSGGDAIYAVGSYFFEGRRHPQKGTEERALQKFKRLLSIAETPEGAAHGGWNEDDIQELCDICDELQDVIASGPEESGDEEHDAKKATVRASMVAKLTRHATAARLIKVARRLLAGDSEIQQLLKKMDKFTWSYADTALATTTDEADESGGEPLDRNHGVDAIDAATLKQMIADCDKFQSENADALAASTFSDEVAGELFWLNRNGHGHGFWGYQGAAGYKDPAVVDALEKLDASSKQFKEVDLYLGDDGTIYGT